MGTVVVIVLTIVTALAISWVTWLVTQHIIAQDRKRLLAEGKPSIPITFDDRLRELRDTFQSVYDLLYPDPTTRPVAGVGWCPPSPAEVSTGQWWANECALAVREPKLDAPPHESNDGAAGTNGARGGPRRPSPR